MRYYLFPLRLPSLLVKNIYATRSLSFSYCNITTFSIPNKPIQGVALCLLIYTKLNFQLIKRVLAVFCDAVSRWEKNNCARSSQERIKEATDRFWEFLTGLIQILDGFGAITLQWDLPFQTDNSSSSPHTLNAQSLIGNVSKIVKRLTSCLMLLYNARSRRTWAIHSSMKPF